MNKLIALFTVFFVISNITTAETTGILEIRANVISNCIMTTQPTMDKNDSKKNLINVKCNNTISDLNSSQKFMSSNINMPSVAKSISPNKILNLTVIY